MSITGKTKLMGVIGYPVSHTASPVMHHAAYKYLGCDYTYVPLLVQPDALKSAIDGIRALSFMGVNVTIPYKEKVIPYLDKLDPQAEKIGAVNTIVNDHGCLTGYNTDGAGFVYALEQEENFSISGKRVVILGAGGAAKGIGFQCLDAKSLCIVNRSLGKAQELAESITLNSASLFPIREKGGVSSLKIEETPVKSPEGGGQLGMSVSYLSSHSHSVQEVLSQADLVINTTPLGMVPDEAKSPLDNYAGISAKTFCCDIIYKPAETVFLKASRAQGALVLGGAGMLAGQGVLAFKLFTGLDVPYTVMRAALR